MQIAGVQKLSMVDFPGKLACVVFTGGCNLRCRYCHNSNLIKNPPTACSEEELLDFLKSRKGKLDGVCVTGGEPCIHPDLPEFLRKLKKTGLALKLDTNGSFPGMLEQLIREKLPDYVAMDIKNDPEGYGEITGVEEYSIEPLCESLRLLLDSGIAFELRTTVVEPFFDEQSFGGIVCMLMALTDGQKRKIPRFCLQAFRDSEYVPFAGLGTPEEGKMQKYKKILEEAAEEVILR